MPNETLPLTRSELFYLGGVVFNWIYRRGESIAGHLACVGAGMGTQHSCDFRRSELQAGWRQPALSYGARKTAPYPPEHVQYAEPLIM